MCCADARARPTAPSPTLRRSGPIDTTAVAASAPQKSRKSVTSTSSLGKQLRDTLRLGEESRPGKRERSFTADSRNAASAGRFATSAVGSSKTAGHRSTGPVSPRNSSSDASGLQAGSLGHFPGAAGGGATGGPSHKAWGVPLRNHYAAGVTLPSGALLIV